MDSASELRDGVRRVYSAVADQPGGQHPFAVGRAFAERLGYPAAILSRIPDTAAEAFTGVSDVSVLADIPAGARVLDLGCGSGLDSIVAANRPSRPRRVIGLDFSAAMLARARKAAAEARLANIEFALAAAERLPLPAGSVDVALVNGMFNLNPARGLIFRELARVVRPGGAVYAAELILREPRAAAARPDRADWFT